MAILFLLLLVFVGPPLLGGWLLARFFKLSQVSELQGHARTRRLTALAGLAVLITLSGYVWVLIISEPLPGAHAASRSAWPWAHEHPNLVVLLASTLVTLLLLRQPAQRLAGLSFGAGALLVLTGLGIHWYFTDHQEDVKRDAFWQLRQADITYRDSGARLAALDSEVV